MLDPFLSKTYDFDIRSLSTLSSTSRGRFVFLSGYPFPGDASRDRPPSRVPSGGRNPGKQVGVSISSSSGGMTLSGPGLDEGGVPALHYVACGWAVSKQALRLARYPQERSFPDHQDERRYVYANALAPIKAKEAPS